MSVLLRDISGTLGQIRLEKKGMFTDDINEGCERSASQKSAEAGKILDSRTNQ